MTIEQNDKWELVIALYKSGVYIGELMEMKPTKAVVKILAVHKHPTQGDLHHPNQVDVPLFHQRRALAYQEKALVPLPHIMPYEGDVPDYYASLFTALEQEIKELEHKEDRWASQSLEQLRGLQEEYQRERS